MHSKEMLLSRRIRVFAIIVAEISLRDKVKKLDF